VPISNPLPKHKLAKQLIDIIFMSKKLKLRGYIFKTVKFIRILHIPTDTLYNSVWRCTLT